jgi:hypothetical protein
MELSSTISISSNAVDLTLTSMDGVLTTQLLLVHAHIVSIPLLLTLALELSLLGI